MSALQRCALLRGGVFLSVNGGHSANYVVSNIAVTVVGEFAREIFATMVQFGQIVQAKQTWVAIVEIVD